MFYILQAKAAQQRFRCTEGDHITLVNVLRAYMEEAEKHGNGTTSKKSIYKWCRENFVNDRSLRRAIDIYRYAQGSANLWCIKKWHFKMFALTNICKHSWITRISAKINLFGIYQNTWIYENAHNCSAKCSATGILGNLCVLINTKTLRDILVFPHQNIQRLCISVKLYMFVHIKKLVWTRFEVHKNF